MSVIGVDLGGTKVLVSVVADGGVGASVKLDTPTGGPEAVVQEIAAAISDLGGAARVGVGTPGVVDQARGTVSNAPNMAGWSEPVPLKALLVEAMPRTEI